MNRQPWKARVSHSACLVGKSSGCFANPSDTAARLLELDAPAGFEPYSERLAEAAPAGSQLDPAVMLDIGCHDGRPEADLATTVMTCGGPRR
jgi:hypothetical protein